MKMNKVQNSFVLVVFMVAITSTLMITIGNNAFGQTFEMLENEKLFGYEGHDFNTFFFEGDLSGLDTNVIQILKDQTTYRDWTVAQDVAKKELISDQARLSFCQQLKNEGYYQPFVNCNEAIYDQFLYQNMYKMLATKKLIDNAKKLVLQSNTESSLKLNNEPSLKLN